MADTKSLASHLSVLHEALESRMEARPLELFPGAPEGSAEDEFLLGDWAAPMVITAIDGLEVAMERMESLPKAEAAILYLDAVAALTVFEESNEDLSRVAEDESTPRPEDSWQQGFRSDGTPAGTAFDGGVRRALEAIANAYNIPQADALLGRDMSPWNKEPPEVVDAPVMEPY